MSNYSRAETREKPPSLNKRELRQKDKILEEKAMQSVCMTWHGSEQRSNCLSPASWALTSVMSVTALVRTSFRQIISNKSRAPPHLSVRGCTRCSDRKTEVSHCSSLHAQRCLSHVEKRQDKAITLKPSGGTQNWLEGKLISLDHLQNAKITFVFADFVVSILYQLIARFYAACQETWGWKHKSKPSFLSFTITVMWSWI